MTDVHYPEGTAAALLATDLLTPRTRAVLAARLEEPDGDAASAAPRFFAAPELATLRAATARLIAPPDGAPTADLAAAIDARLANGEGNGWRYAALPPDGEAYRRGLHAMNETARDTFGAEFMTLDPASQDAVLRAIQTGDVRGAAWDGFAPTRWFEELLAELVELHYTRVLVQDEIGYSGYADAHGWQSIGLNELHAWEPRPIAPPPR